MVPRMLRPRCQQIWNHRWKRKRSFRVLPYIHWKGIVFLWRSTVLLDLQKEVQQKGLGESMKVLPDDWLRLQWLMCPKNNGRIVDIFELLLGVYDGEPPNVGPMELHWNTRQQGDFFFAFGLEKVFEKGYMWSFSKCGQINFCKKRVCWCCAKSTGYDA